MNSMDFFNNLQNIFNNETVKNNIEQLMNSLKGRISILIYLKFKSEANVETTAGDLANYFKISTARVAKSLNNLEEGCKIIRKKSKNDKRVTIIALTEEGLRDANEVVNYHLNLIGEKLKRINEEELKVFFDVINKLVY